MSRVGRNPIVVPDKVEVTLNDGTINVKGPLGQLSYKKSEDIDMSMEDNKIVFSRRNELKKNKAMHGLTRALVNNMVVGVSNGWEKSLSIEGVGFKAELRGNRLLLYLGFSHTILLIPPQGITFEVPAPVNIKIKGIDKQVVGEIAAKIRKLRPPEPYKGKGVRYTGEYIRRKAGKTSAK